jgi:L-fucose isomerase-like protein
MSIDQKTLLPRIGVASLCSPLEVGADRAPQVAGDAAALFQTAGCEVVALGAIDRPEKAAAAGRSLAEAHAHAVVLVAASWFEDYLAFDLWEECRVPLLLWSLPGMETGALCGVQQLTACLKQLGTPYRAVYGPLDSPACRQPADAFLRAAALTHRLRRARIGLAGHRLGGMTEVAVDELALKRTFGPRIVPLDLPQLLAAAQQVPDQEAARQWQAVVGRVAACKVPESDGLGAIKMFLALRQLVDREGLDALAVGCYPHLMGRVCLAASLLADQGVPMACEGDVHGAVGQLMLTLLSGQPTHNTDWLDPLDDGTVVFSHCGSGSFSLAEKPGEIELAPVRLMGQGVCALFPARPGPVTLVSIGAYGSAYQIALLEGEALPTGMVFPGNPLRVRFTGPVANLVDWVHDEGIGHHWMAGYGHLGDQLRQWAGIAGEGVRVVQR